MSKLDYDKIYPVSELIVSKRDSKGINLLVGLDDSQNFFKIDGIASDVWDLLLEAKTLNEIIIHVNEQYPDHLEQIKKDVEQLIHQLLELKVIKE